jgi:hypothetical protein
MRRAGGPVLAIRVVVYARGGERCCLPGPLRVEGCRIVNVELSDEQLYAVWLTCESINTMLSAIDQLLYAGLVPLAAASIDGTVVSFLDKRTGGLSQLAAGETPMLEGSIVVHCGHDLKRCAAAASKVRFRSLKLKLGAEGGEATIVLAEPVSASIFFDAGVRVLKPQRIPPSGKEGQPEFLDNGI